MNSDHLTPSDGSSAPLLECPECGEHAVATVLTPHTFTYGRGKEAVQITAELPMRSCGHCRFQYLDKAGQDAQHEAVCHYLRVMTPRQIKAMREYHGLSRAELATLTGLGEATIARWERGAFIQNLANDLYLRLVGFHDNLQRLRRLTAGDPSLELPTSEQGRPTFSALSDECAAKLREEQVGFRL